MSASLPDLKLAKRRASSLLVAMVAVVALFGTVAAAPWGAGEGPGEQTPPRITPPTAPGKPSNPIRMPSDKQGEKSGDDLVQMTVSADVTQIKPGKMFLLAFIFKIEPGWHVYWQNSGVSGGPTEIEVKAPHWFTVGRTLFPRPQVISTPEGPCYGYENEVVLFVEITPPDSSLAQVVFTAEASWMVCKEVCKLGSAESMLSMSFGGSGLPSATPMAIDPAVGKFKPRLPKELSTLSSGSVAFDGKELVITLPANKHTEVEVFPNPTPGVEFGDPNTEVVGRNLRTTVPIVVNANNAERRPMRVRGVIGVGKGLDDACYWFDIPLTDDGRPQPKES